MIRKINKNREDVLYKPTCGVGPLITKNAPNAGPALESQVSSLSDQSTQDAQGFTVIWPDDIKELVQDLKDTCEDIKDSCMGMAATQIWWKPDEPCPAIFVMRWPISKEDDPHFKDGWEWKEFINPIVKLSGKTVKMEEGCLSYPNVKVKKTRKHVVDFTFQTLNHPKQARLLLNMTDHGWVPHVIQHEYDHLRGVCVRSQNWVSDNQKKKKKKKVKKKRR
jgi:peptide deformylase